MQRTADPLDPPFFAERTHRRISTRSTATRARRVHSLTTYPATTTLLTPSEALHPLADPLAMKLGPGHPEPINHANEWHRAAPPRPRCSAARTGDPTRSTRRQCMKPDRRQTNP